MSGKPHLDAREFLAALIAELPAARAIDAGATSYRWLLTHAADETNEGPPALLGLPISERGALPLDLIAVVDGDGHRITSVDVTQLPHAS